MIKIITTTLSLIFLTIIGYLVISNITGYIDCNNKRILYKANAVYMMVSGCMVKEDDTYIPMEYYESMMFDCKLY